MPLLIDTWNVLHITGVLPPALAGMGIAEFVDLLQVSRYQGERITLVCDGVSADGASSLTGSAIRVRFSGPIRSADDVIIAMVEKSTAPRRLLVVSSDREIQRAARRRKATVVSSDTFLKQLVFDYQSAVPLPEPIALPPTGSSLPPAVVTEAESLALLEPLEPVPPPPPAPPAPPPEPTERARSPKVTIPVDILAEAMAMETADRAERTQPPAPTPADSATPPTTPPTTPPPPPPPPATPPAANPPVLPADLIREALELESAAPRRQPPPPAKPAAPAPSTAAPVPAADPLLPRDIWQEAMEIERTGPPPRSNNPADRNLPEPPPPPRAGGFVFPDDIMDEAERHDRPGPKTRK